MHLHYLCSHTAELALSADICPHDVRRQKLEAMLAEHKGHEVMHNEMVLIILFVTMGAQMGLGYWRRVDPRSYQVWALGG